MADVVGIDGRRRDPLEEAIRLSFHERGQALATASRLNIAVDTWRLTARRVARQLGRRVRTFHVDDTVYAVLTDWPSDDRERAISDQALRDAMRAVSEEWS